LSLVRDNYDNYSMSDLDDEILELAGAGEKKRKKPHSSKSNKRRKE